MISNTTKLTAALLAVVLCSGIALGQTFEGWITYKVEAMNPNPKKIPDSLWQQTLKEKLGEKGYMTQKYYYKKDKYISEMVAKGERGFQAYNPKDKLIYSWQFASDTALTVKSEKYMDEVVEFIDSDLTETILGVPCRAIIVKSKLGKTTLWYNPEHLKMDPKFFKGHVYGNWEAILKKIQCLPLKMETKGFMVHTVQTAIEYKVEPIDDTHFALPMFKEVVANPIN